MYNCVNPWLMGEQPTLCKYIVVYTTDKWLTSLRVACTQSPQYFAGKKIKNPPNDAETFSHAVD